MSLSERWQRRRDRQLERDRPIPDPVEFVDHRLNRLVDRLRALDVRVENLEDWRESGDGEEKNHG